MSPNQSLPVLVPEIPGQSWSCHSCGDCCRSLVGELSDEERARIDEQGWADKLGVAPYVKVGKGWALNKRDDNTCVFLDEGNRCRIHAEYGEQAKPFDCRIFPFSVREVQGAWQASLRFDCPSVIASRGELVHANRMWLQFLLKERLHEDPAAIEKVALQKGIDATDFELKRVKRAFLAWFNRMELPFHFRLLGAAHAATTLATADLRKVRGERFAELLDILFEALPAELETNLAPPTDRQSGMLRQLVFAHVEHVTLAERTATTMARLNMRRLQLRKSREFRKGTGPVPSLAEVSSEVTFEEVEEVAPDPSVRTETEFLLLRYLNARLESNSVFGDGYYGWTVFNGLTALCSSMAVVGWLSRYIAAADGNASMGFHHIGWALGTMDRGATRFPALGTMAERARMSYFHLEGGLKRLVNHYSLLNETDDDESD